MVFTNNNLFENENHDDKLFVVCNKPIGVDDGFEISISLDQTASVLERNLKENYKDQLTVEHIRKSEEGPWLLSGGVVLFDHRDRIAIGLRNGNAADPFAYSNIGAGRCDRKLIDHCNEELASEMVLFVKDTSGWHRVLFGEKPKSFNFENFSEDYQGISKSNAFKKLSESYDGSEIIDCELNINSTRKGVEKLTVKWIRDQIISWKEELFGYIFIDDKNRTIEFRLCLQIDLSKYEEVKIFYKEGPGFALWKTIPQIKGLVDAKTVWQDPLVTPLLEYIASM